MNFWIEKYLALLNNSRTITVGFIEYIKNKKAGRYEAIIEVILLFTKESRICGDSNASTSRRENVCVIL